MEEKKRRTNLEAPLVIRTNPIAYVVRIRQYLLVHSAAIAWEKRFQFLVSDQESTDKVFVQFTHPIQSLLDIETELHHQDRDEVVLIVSSALPI